VKKWAKEVSRALSKEEVQMAKTHMKKCSTSLAIREKQIKMNLRFYLMGEVAGNGCRRVNIVKHCVHIYVCIETIPEIGGERWRG
jgi:hypothetical protein